jgi:hypothetical protein
MSLGADLHLFPRQLALALAGIRFDSISKKVSMAAER